MNFGRWLRERRAHRRAMEKLRIEHGSRKEVADAQAIPKIVVGVMAVMAIVAVAGLTAVVALLIAPVEGSLRCHGKVDGNVQFDGREIRTAGLYDWTGHMVRSEYVGGIPAREGINVPDFTQGRINGIDIECEGSGKWPAYMLFPIIFSEVSP